VMELDDNNVDDLYRVAKRKLPEGVAANYWDELLEEQGDDNYDPVAAKAMVAVLALHPDVVQAVEAAAEQLVRTWLKKYQKSISKLPDAKKALYEPVKRETRSPELTDLILPTSMTVSDKDQHWTKHLLASEDGTYPLEIKGWELDVLEHELADHDLVGWYRNPTGGTAALRVPWNGGEFDRKMYPDFVMFHQTDDGIRPSIVDPHGPYLSDAVGKLKGLAEYASFHGDNFDRVDAVAKVDKTLLTLDLRSNTVRDAVGKLKSGGVEALFKKHGANYI
jgi:type III restriction enzyme